jgi:LuxR family transcriptional regulator, maltose regulon positive regulatory protein
MTNRLAIDAHMCEGGAGRSRRHERPALFERRTGPPVLARLVPRPRLTHRLSSPTAPQLIVLVAPAGYGKTMLLCDWSAHDPRPFAWVTLDREHNDPACLEASIAHAVQRVEPERGSDRLVLVLDDLQRLVGPAAQRSLAALVENLPPAITLAVASRTASAFPLARLRVQGRVAELGPGDLAMDADETAALLRRAGLALEAEESFELWSRTEGWPAAAALGAMLISDGRASGAPAAFEGADRGVADYLREEVLPGLRAEQRRLMLESSLLDTLSGPLCDHVLQRTGSAGAMSELAVEHLVLVPVDRSGERFRHRRLVAEMLRAELLRDEPARAAVLHRRASEWYRRAGDVDLAIRHAAGAGEVGRAAELVWGAAPTALSHGRKAAVEGWLTLFTDGVLAATPQLALAKATTELASGHGHLAEHWARIAAAARTAGTIEPGTSMVRATLARGGLAEMRRDAERACAREPEPSPWRAIFCLLGGTAAQLAGRGDEASRRLEEGARRAAVTAPDVHAVCLTQLALGALDDWEEVTELVARARAQAERYDLGDYPTAAVVFAASALVRAHRGRVEAAQRDFETARRLRSRLIDFAAWYVVELDLVLARAAVKLSDLGCARGLLADASRTIQGVPDAPVLASWLADSWSQLDSALGPEHTPPSVLTIAELRTLRFLPTHLSFREIAERASVSANTVKSQANAVYRKLDVTCRSDAVARARRLGLLDA